VTDVIEDAEGAVEAPAREFKIPIKTGWQEERLVELGHGRSITTILEIVAGERGCLVEELIIVREGEHEPLTALVLIEEHYPHKHRHHVHHLGEVVVTVYYQASDKKHHFKRSATIDDVLAWAVEAFRVDPAMAAEFELTRHDHKEELPGSEHVGHLAGAHKELALDLVRGDIANGAAA
jgi:hypothetical protein